MLGFGWPVIQNFLVHCLFQRTKKFNFPKNKPQWFSRVILTTQFALFFSATSKQSYKHILPTPFPKRCTGGPHYLRTFYLHIHLFTFQYWSRMTIFWSKMDFLFANSRFAVKNDRTYLPPITRETSTYFLRFGFKHFKAHSDIPFTHAENACILRTIDTYSQAV